MPWASPRGGAPGTGDTTDISPQQHRDGPGSVTPSCWFIVAIQGQFSSNLGRPGLIANMPWLERAAPGRIQPVDIHLQSLRSPRPDLPAPQTTWHPDLPAPQTTCVPTCFHPKLPAPRHKRGTTTGDRVLGARDHAPAAYTGCWVAPGSAGTQGLSTGAVSALDATLRVHTPLPETAGPRGPRRQMVTVASPVTAPKPPSLCRLRG